jgi:hypothetical protein
MDSTLRLSYPDDWDIFWAIEEKDASKLSEICQQIKTDVKMYFGMVSWQKVFTKEEAEKIKVYMCGMMDFGPLQHACYLGWTKGMVILYESGVGLTMGSGLPYVEIKDLDKLKAISH